MEAFGERFTNVHIFGQFCMSDMPVKFDKL